MHTYIHTSTTSYCYYADAIRLRFLLYVQLLFSYNIHTSTNQQIKYQKATRTPLASCCNESATLLDIIEITNDRCVSRGSVRGCVTHRLESSAGIVLQYPIFRDQWTLKLNALSLYTRHISQRLDLETFWRHSGNSDNPTMKGNFLSVASDYAFTVYRNASCWKLLSTTALILVIRGLYQGFLKASALASCTFGQRWREGWASIYCLLPLTEWA